MENDGDPLELKHSAPTKNGKPYFHMNEAIMLKGGFAKKNGWTYDKVRSLIDDLLGRMRELRGRPISCVSTTVLLNDHKRATELIPDTPPAAQLCAVRCVFGCLLWYGTTVLATTETGYPPGCAALFFDRSEDFYGHVMDRWNHKKAGLLPGWQAISQVTEVDMRGVPGMQMADLLAWCQNRSYGAGGYEDICESVRAAIPGQLRMLTYNELSRPKMEALEQLKQLNLPKRRPMR